MHFAHVGMAGVLPHAILYAREVFVCQCLPFRRIQKRRGGDLRRGLVERLMKC